MSEWANLTAMAESAARGGKYGEAKDCYAKALSDADSRHDVNNAYTTRCNFAGLLRLLDEYGPAEQLLKQATQLRHDHPELLAREPVSPFTDLERILAKQNRLPELEQLYFADTNKMLTVFGRESFEYKMSLMALAKSYGLHFKDIDKCKAYFGEVLQWAETAEPITRKMMYMEFDGVLRASGLTTEANALQAQLAARQQSPA